MTALSAQFGLVKRAAYGIGGGGTNGEAANSRDYQRREPVGDDQESFIEEGSWDLAQDHENFSC